MTSELRVDFYILEEASGKARLSLACKLAEKAYLAAQSVLIWHTDLDEIRTLDEMLWTFRDGSFVPHDVLAPEAAGAGTVAAQAGTAALASAAVLASASVHGAYAVPAHGDTGAAIEAPVLLSARAVPHTPADIIINLAVDVPDFVAQAKRVVEIIDGDEGRRRAGRARFKAYRDRGVQPASHNL